MSFGPKKSSVHSKNLFSPQKIRFYDNNQHSLEELLFITNASSHRIKLAFISFQQKKNHSNHQKNSFQHMNLFSLPK